MHYIKSIISCIAVGILSLSISGCKSAPLMKSEPTAYATPKPLKNLPSENSANEIIRKVDEVRNPQGDYIIAVGVISYSKGKESKSATYEVMIKGKDNTLIKTIKPENERGRVLLMKERNLWAFFPEVSKPLRISMQERLIGEVSNGDIARANFSGDYDATLQRVETIEGKKYYVLELAALTPEVTYGKVTLWVGKENLWPLKAYFYAISGKLLKTCVYENFVKFGERVRPTRLVMEDPVFKGKKSLISYGNLRTGQLPEKYFTKDYMKKMME